MGNTLAYPPLVKGSQQQSTFQVDKSGATTGVVPVAEWRLDCRNGRLALVDHHNKVIVYGGDWQSGLLQSETFGEGKKNVFSKLGDLPLSLLIDTPKPCLLEARRLLNASPSFSSFPGKSDHSFSPFCPLLIKAMCSHRRIQLDMMRSRAEVYLRIPESDLRLFRAERAKDLVEQCKIGKNEDGKASWIPLNTEKAVREASHVLADIKQAYKIKQLDDLLKKAKKDKKSDIFDPATLGELKSQMLSPERLEVFEKLDEAVLLFRQNDFKVEQDDKVPLCRNLVKEDDPLDVILNVLDFLADNIHAVNLVPIEAQMLSRLFCATTMIAGSLESAMICMRGLLNLGRHCGEPILHVTSVECLMKIGTRLEEIGNVIIKEYNNDDSLPGKTIDENRFHGHPQFDISKLGERGVPTSLGAAYVLTRLGVLSTIILDTGAHLPFLPYALTFIQRGYQALYKLLDFLIKEYRTKPSKKPSRPHGKQEVVNVMAAQFADLNSAMRTLTIAPNVSEDVDLSEGPVGSGNVKEERHEEFEVGFVESEKPESGANASLDVRPLKKPVKIGENGEPVEEPSSRPVSGGQSAPLKEPSVVQGHPSGQSIGEALLHDLGFDLPFHCSQVLPDCLVVLTMNIMRANLFHIHPSIIAVTGTAAHDTSPLLDGLLYLLEPNEHIPEEFSDRIRASAIEVISHSLLYFFEGQLMIHKITLLGHLLGIDPADEFTHNISEDVKKHLRMVIFGAIAREQDISAILRVIDGRIVEPLNADPHTFTVLSCSPSTREYLVRDRVLRMIGDMQSNAADFNRNRQDTQVIELLGKLFQIMALQEFKKGADNILQLPASPENVWELPIGNLGTHLNYRMSRDRIARKLDGWNFVCSIFESLSCHYKENVERGNFDDLYEFGGAHQYQVQLLCLIQRDILGHPGFNDCDYETKKKEEKNDDDEKKHEYGKDLGEAEKNLVVKYGKVLLRHCVDAWKLTHKYYDDQKIRVSWLRRSFVGTLLPSFLVSFVYLLMEIPEVSEDILGYIRELHALGGGFQGLSSSPLTPYSSEKRLVPFDYLDLETLLDASSALGDFLSVHMGHRNEEQKFTYIQEYLQKCVDFDKDAYDMAGEEGVVKCFLDCNMKDVATLNAKLMRVLGAAIFGKHDQREKYSEKELSADRNYQIKYPSLLMCPFCEHHFPSNIDLVRHSIFGTPSVSGLKPDDNVCSNLTAWMSYTSHIISWTLSKLAHKLVSGDVGLNHKSLILSMKPDEKTDTPNDWLRSELFSGGLENAGMDIVPPSETAKSMSSRQKLQNAENQSFMQDMRENEGAAAVLNEMILSLPAFRMFPHRRLGGEEVNKAIRSVICVLLKHSGALSRTIQLGVHAKECKDEGKGVSETFTDIFTPSPQVLKIWSQADKVKAHLIKLHQDGILTYCATIGCNQTCMRENETYHCGDEHVSSDCDVKDSAPYSMLATQVIEKCEFLLSLSTHSKSAPDIRRQGSLKVRRLLRQKSVQLYQNLKKRRHSTDQVAALEQTQMHETKRRYRSMRNSLLQFRPEYRNLDKPQFHTSVVESVVVFIKDDTVDIKHLNNALNRSVSRAKQRAEGMTIFREILKRGDPMFSHIVFGEVMAALRSWPSRVSPGDTSDGIAGLHFMDHLETAGDNALNLVSESYTVLSGQIMATLTKLLENKLDVSRTMNFLLSLLDFWKVAFKESDYPLLRSIKLITSLEQLMDLRYETATTARAAQDSELISSVSSLTFRSICLICLAPIKKEDTPGPRRKSRGDHDIMSLLQTERLDTFQKKLLESIESRLIHGIKVQTDEDEHEDFVQYRDLIEEESFSVLSLVLLICGRTELIRDYVQQHNSWSRIIMTIMMNPSIFSCRQLRRAFRLAQLIFPLREPSSVAEVYSGLKTDSSACWPLITVEGPDQMARTFVELLIRHVGFLSSAQYFQKCTSDFTIDHVKRSHLRIETVDLIKTLSKHDQVADIGTVTWGQVVRSVFEECCIGRLSEVLPLLDYDDCSSLTDEHRELIYRVWGALTLLADRVDTIREGSRCYVSTSTSSIEQIATIVEMDQSRILVVLDSDPSLKPIDVDISDVTILKQSDQESLEGSILHNYVKPEVIAGIFKLILKIKHDGGDGTLDTNVKSDRSILASEADTDQSIEMREFASDAQLLGVRAVCESLRAENESYCSGSSAVDRERPFLRAVQKDADFVRQLLSLARNPISIRGAGNLYELEQTSIKLQALLFERSSGRMSLEESSSDLIAELYHDGHHIDLCKRAVKIFESDREGMLAFLNEHRRQVEKIELKIDVPESGAESGDIVSVHFEAAKRLSEFLDVPIHMAHVGLRVHFGNYDAAAAWLLDLNAEESAEINQSAQQDYENKTAELQEEDQRIRKGLTPLEWPKETMDHFFEMGDYRLERDLYGPRPYRYTRIVTDSIADRVYYGRNKAGLNNRPIYGGSIVTPSAVEKLADEKETKHLPLAPDQVRPGMFLRISPEWAAETEKIESLSTDNYLWIYLSPDNQWVEFDTENCGILEELYAHGGSKTCVYLEVQHQLFFVRIDKMAMYHAESSMVVRIKRKGEIPRAPSSALEDVSSENEEETEPLEIDEKSDPYEDEMNLLMDQMSREQQEGVSALAVLGYKRSWCVRALLHCMFDRNAAVEWILANREDLEIGDAKEAMAKKRRVVRLKDKKKKIKLQKRKQRKLKSLAPVLAFCDRIGLVRSVSMDRAQVQMDLYDRQTDQLFTRWCPIEGLEWADEFVWKRFPELVHRTKHGISGLAMDVNVSLSILYARRCVFSILSSCFINGAEIEGISQLKEDGQKGLFRILKLLSSDPSLGSIGFLGASKSSSSNTAISIEESKEEHSQTKHERKSSLDLAENLRSKKSEIWDVSGYCDGRGIWPLISALAKKKEYQVQMIELLVSEMVGFIKLAATSKAVHSSSHPYHGEVNVKKQFKIKGASSMILTFDERSSMAEGHAYLGFFLDEDCTQEIAVISGSGPERFRPVLVPGDTFWLVHESKSRASAQDFGFKMLAIPLGWRYEDEQSLLNNPTLGWCLLSLITDEQHILDTVIGMQPLFNKLIQTMFKYLTTDGPWKMFVTHSMQKIMLRHSELHSSNDKDDVTKHIRNKFKVEIGKTMGIMHQLHKTNRSAPGAIFSPYLCGLIDLARMFCDKMVRKTMWDSDESFVLCNVDRAECLLRALNTGASIPSEKIIEKVHEEKNDFSVLIWCVSQFEICINLNMQEDRWKEERRLWTQMVRTCINCDPLGDIMMMLFKSMKVTAFKEDDEHKWTDIERDKWEEQLTAANTPAEYAKCLFDFENALKWDDHKESDRAMVNMWRSRRFDWRVACEGLSEGDIKDTLPSAKDSVECKWTREMNIQLVQLVDTLITKGSRRMHSLTFRDIKPLSDQEQQLYPSLIGVPIEHLRIRFGVLWLANRLFSTQIIHFIEKTNFQKNCLWDLVSSSKYLFYFGVKLAILQSANRHLYSTEPEPQAIVLNRHEAAKERKIQHSKFKHSLFQQCYSQISLCDVKTLRRQGPSWRVKFVGEGGHDAGGLYNDSLNDMCAELQSQALPLFIQCPNGVHNIGDNREKWVPNPSMTSVTNLKQYQFVGILIGIALLDLNLHLPLDFPSVVWKSIAREPLCESDLKAIDYPVWKTLNMIRNNDDENINEESFEYIFPEMNFTTESSDGREVELMPGGKDVFVTYENRIKYADLVERYRLREYQTQIGAICRGVALMVRFDYLAIFSSQQLEQIVCGNPNVNVELLKSKTVYVGNVRFEDRHIQVFWEVITEMSREERKSFIQFVWGRSRLPSTAVGFGKDVFKIQDISKAESPDTFLPTAHTCFFQLDLPRYTSKEVMRTKLIYAIQHCRTIDNDVTQEGMRNLNMSWSDDESDDEM